MSRTLAIIAAAVIAATSCGDNIPAYPDYSGQNPDTDSGNQEEPPVMPDLGYDVLPYGNGVCTDTSLELTFGSAPAAGAEGCIRIYREDGELVDEIDMADLADPDAKMTNESIFNTSFDAIGTNGYYRIIRYSPVKIEGNTVTIKPHYASLDYRTSYYVTIDRNALDVEGFEGITVDDKWEFTTREKPDAATVTVGKSGCDFQTVQAAIDYACSLGQTREVTINVRNGVYEEKLYIRSKKNLSIIGESREGVIIRERNSENLSYGTGQGTTSIPAIGSAIGKSGGRPVIFVENCDMLRFENLTLENTYGNGSQAEVIYNNDNSGTGRIIFVDCNITSEQDTVCLKGYGWFYNCTITGDVDFIWGYPQTVLMEKCEIISCDKGYIVQCRCQDISDKGFVFLDCSLKKKDGVSSVYLAGSGGDSRYSDNVTYINCSMDSHIASAGWYGNPAPNPSSATAAAGWKEYGSRDMAGNPVSTAGRLSSSRILSDEEFSANYRDRETILSGAPEGAAWAVE